MKLSGFFFLLSILFISCEDKPYFYESKSIPQEVWSKDYTVEMDVLVSDTLTFYDLFLNIRNVNSYPYSNLFLFVNVSAPDGSFATDTIEYNLADPYGRWLGSSSAKMWDSKLPFRQVVRFAKSGTYTFRIQHGMRDVELKGIADVGFTVEEARQGN